MTEPSPAEQDTRKLGIGMMILAWLCIFGLLAGFFYYWEEQAYNPNQAPEAWQDQNYSSVILTLNRYHQYIASGKINQQKVTFLLDTGASNVVIPETLAKSLGLSKGRKGYAQTANGVVAVYSTHIDQLTIGSITLYDIDASINPAMKDQEILLGMSALKNIEFTQRGKQLTLKHFR